MNPQVRQPTYFPGRSRPISLKEANSMTRFRPMLLGALCSALALGTQVARAEDAKEPAKPAAPTLADVLGASGITVNGWLDASYSALSGEEYFTSGVPTRVFDDQKNSFTLHQAALLVAYQPKEGFGAVVNLIAGQDADVFAPYSTNPGAHSKFDFPQAYIQYATGPLTIIGGRFVTLAGAETIDPRTMTNFSRSILFGYAIPFAHTGLRGTYAVNDQLSLILGINNGWDDLQDTNTSKTGEVGITYAPIKALSFALSGYFGQERVGGLVNYGPQGERSLVDFVGTWNITDKFQFVVNYDWGQQKGVPVEGMFSVPDGAESPTWWGIAGYFNYQFNDQWRVSLRGEYFDDKDGYRTGIVQEWKEGTLTVGYAPAKSVELRLEGRYDKSNVYSFLKSYAYDSEANVFTDTSNNMGSVGLEGVFKF